jgi:putative addiction module killer protein
MFDGQPKVVTIYEQSDGSRPFEEWFDNLRDRRAQTRVDARIARLAVGNPGDFKSLGEGLYELRIDYGPGYRLYFAFSGRQIVLLLCGGDKKSQSSDIATARSYLNDHEQKEVQ